MYMCVKQTYCLGMRTGLMSGTGSSRISGRRRHKKKRRTYGISPIVFERTSAVTYRLGLSWSVASSQVAADYFNRKQ